MELRPDVLMKSSTIDTNDDPGIWQQLVRRFKRTNIFKPEDQLSSHHQPATVGDGCKHFEFAIALIITLICRPSSEYRVWVVDCRRVAVGG